MSKLKGKAYWRIAKKIFKEDEELLEAWRLALLEGKSDWELYFFYEDIRISEMLRVCKRVSLSIDKRSKEIRIERGGKEELFRVQESRKAYIMEHYRRCAKLLSLRGISGFSKFLKIYNPMIPYEFSNSLLEAEDNENQISLNVDDLNKEKRIKLEKNFEKDWKFKFRSKESKALGWK